MTKNYFNLIFRCFLVGILSFQMVSCGTLIYPERRGAKGGRLDVGIVILDALGLLLGLIPGIIAFAVDFSTGAIYFPDARAKSSHAGKGLYRVVRFDPHQATRESLEALISRETGTDFHFNDQRVQYLKLKNVDDVSQQFENFRNGQRIELGSAVGQ